MRFFNSLIFPFGASLILSNPKKACPAFFLLSTLYYNTV